MGAPAQRYSAVAIVLHWAIAAAIALMIPLGWWMGDIAEEGVVSDGVFRAYQMHKSIGLTVLALSLARLGWRLLHPPPPLPERMSALERFGARAAHAGLYLLMIALPLTGWLYVSAGWSEADDQPLLVTTHWFGLFAVPHLLGLPEAGVDVREAVAETAMSAHSWLAWGAIALVGVHVAAALKHHFVDKDEVLAQMTPGLRAPFQTHTPERDLTRRALLGGGLGLTAVALIAALTAWAEMAREAAAPAAQDASSFDVVERAPPHEAPTTTPGVETASPAPTVATAWRVEPSASSVGFGFTYADDATGQQRFNGRFTRWRADIVFAPDDLANSSANVTIETASATDGIAIHDRSLPGPDWFNATAFPNARFQTTRIMHVSGDAYSATGELTIRDRTRVVTLPFTLTIEGGRAVMNGRTTINRRDFGVGNDTDADDAISREVDIIIHVEATRAP